MGRRSTRIAKTAAKLLSPKKPVITKSKKLGVVLKEEVKPQPVIEATSQKPGISLRSGKSMPEAVKKARKVPTIHIKRKLNIA